jgi:glycosyltransferase involved in cell wall biosynthesis
LWSDARLQRPDVVHVIDDEMADVGLAMCESARLRYVQTITRFGTVAHRLKVSRRWCCGLVATSSDLAQELVDELGIPADRIATISPGITVNPPVGHMPEPGKVPVIGTGGSLEEASGTIAFLKAARLVLDGGHDVEFVIAGDGSDQVDLRHATQLFDVAERVTVADYPSVGPEFWTVLDIYCQPAVRPSTGRTLIQALSYAIPCIASDVKGLRTLIDHGENGLIVPSEDPAALAQAIADLLDHPDEARRMGTSALDRARAIFDPDVEADQLTEIYQQVRGRSEHPRPTRA